MNLICDFHREQAWERWTKRKDHGVDPESILPQLRKIAQAFTAKDYAEAVLSLKKSDDWKNNPDLVRWFSGTWLKCCKVRKL